MKVSTLSIGDEVLFGEIVDTNSAHIAARLYDVGITVRRHLCVGDSEPDIIEAMEALAGSNDFVIATGGLGPTVDDLTAKAASKAAGRHLVLNDDALAHLQQFSFHRLLGQTGVASASIRTSIIIGRRPISCITGSKSTRDRGANFLTN